jgi:hypothetical protein
VSAPALCVCAPASRVHQRAVCAGEPCAPAGRVRRRAVCALESLVLFVCGPCEGGLFAPAGCAARRVCARQPALVACGPYVRHSVC